MRMIGLPVLLAAACWGALVRVEVQERSDVLEGKAFGAVGAYERIVGKAYFAVDPKLNPQVRDLDLAPRNEQGLVEFQADIYVLKPRDPAQGNGAVLYEVSNRGRKGMLTMFNRAAGSLDPRAPGDFGDGLLLEQGYTLLWLGWQFDVPREPGLMRLYTPVIQGLKGLVRAEFVLDAKATSHSVADRNHVPYPVVEARQLTVRDGPDGSRHELPRSAWRIEERGRVVMDAGFEPGRIYELVYASEDPAVVGLGPAAIRDVISFLKYGGNAVTVLGDQRRYIRRAYGFGVSQSGRFLRTFLYHGFNRDEQGRKVFDGLMVHVAGGGRGSFNHRFAQPSRDGHPFFNTLYPTDIFPFTDIEQTDPDTGVTDGLLKRVTADAMPKIFYTNSSYEYWGRAASLIHTTVDGQRDAEIPAQTRIYLFAGGQHGPAGFPPGRKGTQNLSNPNLFTLSMRALLGAMNRWVKDGVQPPASQYPRIGQDQLVTVEALRFPKIPGIAVPRRPQRAYRVDYGPDFASKGIVTVDPPKVGKAFPILVPQVDEDGNETSGIRMPDVQVALATYTGWNLRASELGAPEELFSMAGSFIPFARTQAERQAQGDPRLSVAERYATRAEYLEKLAAAARRLADSGYLLDRDVAAVVERGAQMWELATRR